jgi:hypothetical protein
MTSFGEVENKGVRKNKARCKPHSCSCRRGGVRTAPVCSRQQSESQDTIRHRPMIIHRSQAATCEPRFAPTKSDSNINTITKLKFSATECDAPYLLG